MRPAQRFSSAGVSALVITLFAFTPAHSQTTTSTSLSSASSTPSGIDKPKDAHPRRNKLRNKRTPRIKDGTKSTVGQADMKDIDHGAMKGMDPGGMKGMDHGAMKGMDHGAMKGMEHGATKGMDHGAMKGMDHGATKGMDHSEMKGMDHGDTKAMDHGSMKGMDHADMKGMDHGSMEGMDHADMQGMDHSDMKGMDHGGMKGMNEGADMSGMGAMQGGRAPADARDPDGYADGLSMGPMPGMDMADNEARGLLLVDQLEQYNGRRTRGQSLDLQGWYGTDLNKLWIKVDGERSEGRLGAVRTEALYDRAISTYWSLQAGLRHDFGEGPGRNWAAFGVQGLAPYWFDVEATAYAGEGGRTALRLEAEYDILFTQRLILQPNVKLDIYGKSDPRREIGSGLSQAEAALRLRYEFSRKFAPYVGVVFTTKFGNTARLTREDGGRTTDLRAVAGIRVWY